MKCLKYIKKQDHFVVNRSRARDNTIDTNIKYTVEERLGTILRKRDFDYLFHLIPIENDILKNKIINKFGIIKFSDTFKKFSNYNYAIAISNQFSNKQNINNTHNCIQAILNISNDANAQTIALNIDYDNVRHYNHFKTLFLETFGHNHNIFFK